MTKETKKKLRLSCSAVIEHLNTRKEGPEDDKVLACDLKLRAVVGAEVLGFFDQHLRLALFMPEGQVRNAMIGAIPFTNELADYRMQIAGLYQDGVKVKKFAMKALDGFLVDLAFAVSFKPSGDEVATLAEYLQDSIDVVLEPSSYELDLGDSEEPDAAPSAGSDSDADPLYADAVAIVRESGKPSISLVQRRLQIGYNRAARLLEDIEKAGIVSAMKSNGSREIL